MSSDFDRRDALKILTATAFTFPLQLSAASAGKPLFFSVEEFALLDVLTEHIIPRDAHSPGAHEAAVPAYIDRMVAEAFLPEEKEAWHQGLAEIDRLSIEACKKPFVKAGKSTQIELLENLARKEKDPTTSGEKFFGVLKTTTAFGYYTSETGIHKEMDYQGNVIQQQFSGYEAV